jgi:hypothetical protein
MTIARPVIAFVAAALAAVLLAGVRGQAQQPPAPEDFRPRHAGPAEERVDRACATGRVRADRRALLSGITPLDRLPDGGPISFEQDPPILTPDHRGAVRLRNLLVAGDVASLRFKLGDPDSDEIETWTRTTTRTINGRIVSVFDREWDDAALARVLRCRTWGFDYPTVYWGEILPAGTEEGDGVFVRLRIGSTRIPESPVRQLAADVQYASHVVNIVAPAFGDGRLGRDEHNLPWATVTRKFYEHFDDGYDTLAITMQDVQLSATSGAFHINVRNEVEGIGEDVFNRSALYGSSRLRSIEFFYGSNATSNETTAHELAHQWGSYFDWARIARDVTPGGHQPASHDPLFAEGETIIGAVLDGTRRVRRSDSGWAIEETPGEVRFHPLTRYAMGILPREAVPAITLFNTQEQFGTNRVPDAGTAVNGPTQDLTISHIAAVMGERSGPVDTEWHRAMVVVSRELLTQREMNYWNFFSQRTEDPNHSGVYSLDGFGSFDDATGRQIDLRHEILPRNGERIDQRHEVDFPTFGHDDFRDVRFDQPVPTLYRIGRTYRWSGQLLSPNRADYVQILLRFWKYRGSSDNAVLIRGPISPSGSFQLEHQFQESHKGRRTMEVFLFWPGSGPQTARMIAGPITID